MSEEGRTSASSLFSGKQVYKRSFAGLDNVTQSICPSSTLNGKPRTSGRAPGGQLAAGLRPWAPLREGLPTGPTPPSGMELLRSGVQPEEAAGRGGSGAAGSGGAGPFAASCEHSEGSTQFKALCRLGVLLGQGQPCLKQGSATKGS